MFYIIEYSLVLPYFRKSSDPDNLAISVDAGWQKRCSGRGYNSLSGLLFQDVWVRVGKNVVIHLAQFKREQKTL